VKLKVIYTTISQYEITGLVSGFSVAKIIEFSDTEVHLKPKKRC
jgi:hypothetical protein